MPQGSRGTRRGIREEDGARSLMTPEMVEQTELAKTHAYMTERITLLGSWARASPRAPVTTAALRSPKAAGTHSTVRSTAGILHIDFFGRLNSSEQLDHPCFKTNAHNLHSGKPLATQQSAWPAQPHICGEHDLQGARMTDCNPHIPLGQAEAHSPQARRTEPASQRGTHRQ